jgi:hypothetical protein
MHNTRNDAGTDGVALPVLGKVRKLPDLAEHLHRQVGLAHEITRLSAWQEQQATRPMR